MYSSVRPNLLLRTSLPLFFLLIFSFRPSPFVTPSQSKIAPLRVSPRISRGTSDETMKSEMNSDSVSNSDAQIFYFDQNLDHFTYTPQSYTTFQQRYAIDSKYWGGAESNAPIFAYLGEESSLENHLTSIGFLPENGPYFNALLVYIEHRYYGQSMPFGSAQEALKNATTLGYLNTAQALADYAAILLHVKDEFAAKHSPIIVFGGSYGGMLAAWFRLKYPHIAIGALASSAPLLYFDPIAPKNGYYYIVTNVFKKTSETCHNTIRKSWDVIDRVAAKPNGLLILSKKFKTCAQLNESVALKDYLDMIYAMVVQYNWIPSDTVNTMCNAIDAAPPNGKDLLDRIFAGVVAYMGNQSCYDVYEYVRANNDNLAWGWQSCNEIVMPVGHDKQDTMFQTAPYNMSSHITECTNMYGVLPRPHWITTYYGGQDIKLILRRFGSNIIFSNGLLDPYSVGGVLEDISDTIFAIKTKNGSHCLDLSFKTKEDPEWLVMQRQEEVEIIDSWISKYQKDLRDLGISI